MSYFYVLDLQTVNITLRILFRPKSQALPKIYMNLGEDYDERVLPSITTEVLKAVVVSHMLHFQHVEYNREIFENFSKPGPVDYTVHTVEFFRHT